MARTKTTTTTKPEATAKAPDLMKALLDSLAAIGVKPKVKWAPSRNYASLYVDGQNIGYVFKQTSRGMRIEPAASKADLPKGTKGFRPGTRSARFALVGLVSNKAEAKAAAAVLKAAEVRVLAPAGAAALTIFSPSAERVNRSGARARAAETRATVVTVDDELRDIARTALGAEYGLSPEQAQRLRGETAAELRADAKAMRAELGLAPVDERERDEGGRFVGGDMNARIRAASGR
jgi:hypothetical protein